MVDLMDYMLVEMKVAMSADYFVVMKAFSSVEVTAL